MNEVADDMVDAEKKCAIWLYRNALKIIVPGAVISAKLIAAMCVLSTRLAKGTADMAIDGINVARQEKGSDDKHNYIVTFGNSYNKISKAAAKAGDSLESVEVADRKMLSFETVAQKYGIKYGMRKNEATDPPTWNVYFKAKDRATMTQAFTEFGRRTLANQKETPLEQIKRAMSRDANRVAPEKSMRQNRGER